jgi:hypothetical protein
MRRLKGNLWVLAAVAVLPLVPASGAAQETEVETAVVSGRIYDRQTQLAVEGASVTFDGTSYAGITDENGLFRISGLPDGVYRVVVSHLAYGTHEQTMNVPAGSELAVRIAVGREAIELDPVVVSSQSERERRNRARGVRINELTVDEIEALIPTSRNLADVLQQSIPGLRSVPSALANGYNCIEFRSPATIRYLGDCRSPLTLLDGVRMYDPPLLFSTIDLNSISRIELIPPAEAGAEYGSDSAFGVLLIETKTYTTEKQRAGGGRRPMPGELGGSWNWDLEGSSHPTAKVFLYSFLGNAAGLAAGLALAQQCVEFDRLAVDVFNSSCGRWGTLGARGAALTIPVLGASTAARWSGRTDFSHGRFWPTALAAGVALLPGYAIASSSTVDGFQGTTWVSRFVLLFGVPAATTLADYMYRRFDGS